MPAELTIPKILQIASVCEYLAVVKRAFNNTFRGNDIHQKLAKLIYLERMAVQNRYNLNPSDPTLPATANYLFSILEYQGQAQTILNNLTGGLPVITGPANQSVLVGNTATFSVSVVSATNVSYQWYLNGITILGATSSSYIISNAQLVQSGGLYSVIAMNAAGSVSSAQGLLTVTNPITGFFTYSPTVDFNIDILAHIDFFNYGTSYPITHNQPVSIPLPSAMPSNQYMLIKVPAAESLKNQWFNTAFNNGFIGDVVLNGPQIFGGFTYYASHGQVTMDVSQPLTLT